MNRIIESGIGHHILRTTCKENVKYACLYYVKKDNVVCMDTLLAHNKWMLDDNDFIHQILANALYDNCVHVMMRMTILCWSTINKPTIYSMFCWAIENENFILMKLIFSSSVYREYIELRKLHVAIIGLDNVEIYQYFFENIDKNKYDHWYISDKFMLYASVNIHAWNIVKYLISKNKELLVSREYVYNFLNYSWECNITEKFVSDNNLEMVRFCVENGGCIIFKQSIYAPIVYNNVEMVKYLVETCHFDVNMYLINYLYRNDFSETCKLYCIAKHKSMKECLKKLGLIINLQEHNCYTCKIDRLCCDRHDVFK